VEMHQISMLPELKTNSKKCSSCKEIKPVDQFYTHCKAKDGYQNYCMSCASKIKREYILNKPEQQCVDAMNARTRQRGFEPNEWTKEEIREIMKGKCEATGIPFDMELSKKGEPKNAFVASPDRIDNSKGYTKENTRWVVFIYNTMRNDFREDQVKEFIEHIRQHEINF
jgi:hypothetical protein